MPWYVCLVSNLSPAWSSVRPRLIAPPRASALLLLLLRALWAWQVIDVRNANETMIGRFAPPGPDTHADGVSRYLDPKVRRALLRPLSTPHPASPC